MSRLTIDLGTAGNSATGDSIRAAFEKVNTNFSELYAELGGDSLDTLSFSNNTISSGVTNGTLVLTGNGTGAVDIEGIQINDNQIITTTSNTNLLLDGNGTGTVVINGLSFPIADGTAGQVLKTDGAGNLSFTNVDPGAITIVGDDSTGTAVNIGETFKIAGAGSITTAVSGDTVTITGPDLSSYLTNSTLTVVGDDSTGVTLNSGETIKIAGAGTVTTAVSGDTLTITGTNSNLFDQNLNTTDDVTFSSVSLSGVEDDSTPAVDFFTGDAGNHIVTLHSDWTLKLKARAEGANQGNLWLESGQNTKIKIKGNGSTIDVVASDGTTSSTWTFNKAGSVTFPDSTVQNTAARITVVGDDSTGTTINAGETIKIAGTQNITTAVSGDTLTITGPNLSSYATTTYVDNKVSANNTLTIADDSSTTSSIDLDNTLQVIGSSNITTSISGSTLTITGPNLSSYLTNSTLTVVGDDSTGVTLNSGETIKIAGAGSITTAVSGDTLTITGSASAQGITFVGDDSTGTQISDGETIKIAGTQNISTSMSGDTLTITGPNLSSYATQSYVTSQGYITNSPITLVGDDSTGVTLNSGETIKIAGTQNITTAVSGDTLTVTGPNLTNYAQKSDTAITIVGDDSTGTAITIGETFKIAGAGTVTTSVSGDTITITGSGGGASIGDLTVDGTTISSGSSSKITLNESVDITGTLQVNDINSADSTAIQINDGVNVSGTLTANTFVTNSISSSESSAIQINDSVDISGNLQVSTINSMDSTAIQINDGVNISGTLTANTFVTNNISSSESTAVEVNDGLNVQGTLTANIIQTNEISSTESSAIQVNDSLNSSGTITATSFVTHGTGGSITGVNTLEVNAISSNDSTAIQINDSLDVSGNLQVSTINSMDSSAVTINDGLSVTGTLTANTFVTNNISSSESTAIEVNDSMSVQGTLTANTFVTNSISSTESSAIQIDDAINVSGAGTFHGSVRFNAGYTEKINSLTSSSTITVNCALASVHTVTLGVNTGFVIANLPAGGSVTVIITQDGSGSKTATFGTDTSTAVKFPGGTPTLTTTAGAIDVVTVFNDGTNYLGNIAKAYA